MGLSFPVCKISTRWLGRDIESPFCSFRSEWLLDLKLSVDGCRRGISSSVGTSILVPATVCALLASEPSSCWGLTHPRARRAGLRQPPEGPGRERERGLGRGRDTERDRGCGTLRWGPISASRALLTESGEKPISTWTPVPLPPPPSTLPSFLRTPLLRTPLPRIPYPLPTRSHSWDPSSGTPSSFSRSSTYRSLGPLSQYFLFLTSFSSAPRPSPGPSV